MIRTFYAIYAATMDYFVDNKCTHARAFVTKTPVAPSSYHRLYETIILQL